MVEVLIVLAVTGLLLFSAIVLINGRQNKTEFMTGIHDLQQQIQQVVNETASNYYPNNGSFSCSATGGNAPVISTTGAGQGTNATCVFVGKALRFGDAGGAGTLDNDTYTVYPLIANRQNNLGQEVTAYGATGDAHLVAIAPGTNTNNTPGFPDDSTVEQLPGGITFNYANGNYDSADPTKPANRVVAVAFLTSLGSYSADTSGDTQVLNSGAQQMGLYKFNGAVVPWGDATSTEGTVVDALNSDPVAAAGSNVTLCFTSGTTNESGLITIARGSLVVNLQVYEGTACGR